MHARSASKEQDTKTYFTFFGAGTQYRSALRLRGHDGGWSHLGQGRVDDDDD